jgi:hypothetical protein
MQASLIDMHEFLDAVRIPIRIACKTETGWPMVVSLWFLHQDGLLYCATRKSARIVHYLQNDARCAFEIAEDQPPYCGIRGQARARIEKKLGVDILEKLITRYLGNTNVTLANNLRRKSESEVAIILDPIRIFTWDFSQRMESIWMEDPPEKVCP